ncbi:MAG: cysteine desulfurase [Melioribacter sp.]|nr:cysteine desulfurase [Melioribacter sp.]
MKVYFDNAATTRPHPKVIEAMIPYLSSEYGNPSSIHSFGRKARVLVEEVRELIANFIGANASEIYFTSGGTEANNFIVGGIPKADFIERKRNSILVTSADHHSVIDTAIELNKIGLSTRLAQVDHTTKVVIENYKNLLDSTTSLVSVIHINNETGSINNIKELASDAHQINSYFHSDAVQSFGKFTINVSELSLDALTASAHKINGTKGIGFAYIKSGTPVNPLVIGGSQERNRRGGTENVAAIAGLAEAVRIAELNMNYNFDHVKNLRKLFLDGIKVIDNKGIKINGGADANPYILSITFLSNYYQNDSEAMLMFLDIHGIAASNGAACTSGTIKPSHVILATGYPEDDARGTIRFSFSAENTFKEVNYTLEILSNLAKKFRK